MDENRKKHGWAWAAITLGFLIVAYLMSLGPAVMLVGATGTRQDPFWFGVFQCVYGPLALSEAVLPRQLVDLVQWWIELWDVYHEFH